MNTNYFSGVYAIENTLNGKQYIGSTSNLRKRRLDHFGTLRQGKHDNEHLQRSFNLYGEDVFIFRHLLVCELFELLRYEQGLIDALTPEYNMCQTAGSSLGRKTSDETKEKLRLAGLGNKRSLGYRYSEEDKEKRRQARLGCRNGPGSKRSEETKEKMRQAKLGRKRSKFSEETRKKISRANLGNKRGLNPSEETREKIRQASLGRKPSEETRERMRQAALARWARQKTICSK